MRYWLERDALIVSGSDTDSYSTPQGTLTLQLTDLQPSAEYSVTIVATKTQLWAGHDLNPKGAKLFVSPKSMT